MNPKAAKGIAANISDIAKSQAILAVIDFGHFEGPVDKYTARASCVEAIEKAEANIAQWLIQPMTFKKD